MMRGSLTTSGLLLGALATCLAGRGVSAQSHDAVVLTVGNREGNASSPLLFGTMFEVSVPFLSYRSIELDCAGV